MEQAQVPNQPVDKQAMMASLPTDDQEFADSGEPNFCQQY